MMERYVIGYFLDEHAVRHAATGHSDTTGCVRWNNALCGASHERTWISTAVRTVTCLPCMARSR